jgi:hypothetical protein
MKNELGSISAGTPDDWQQLNVAIDVVASLAEQTSRNANKGVRELSMFKAFDATFAYMVEYLHHLTIDQDTPSAALAKAATVAAFDMNALRALLTRMGPHHGRRLQDVSPPAERPAARVRGATGALLPLAAVMDSPARYL